MRKKLVLVGVAFGVFVLLILMVSALTSHISTSKNKSVSDMFVSDVLKGDAKSSYALFTAKAKQDQSYDSWQQQVANFSLFFTASQPKPLKTTPGSGNTTICSYKVAGNDGEYVFTVVLDNGKPAGVLSFNSSPKQT